MALPGTYCTPADLRNLSEYISTEVRDNGRLRQYQLRADSIIRDTLRPIYTIESGLYETPPWNGPPLSPFALPDDGIDGNSGSASLSDVTVATTADKTATYTLTFSDATDYTITSDLEGSQGSGTISTSPSSTNGDLTIPAGNWSGTPAAGDAFTVNVYRAKPLIVSISALLSAGLMLKSVSQGGPSDQGDDFFETGRDLLKNLQRPYEDDGLQLDSFSPRDITPQGIAYTVDITGRNVTKFADNEMTPWNDSSPGGYGFYYGPVWLKYWG